METIQDLGKFTLTALYKNTMRKFSECTALSFVSGKPLTYADLDVRTEEFRRQLYRLGVEKGAKIAIFSNSMPNWGAAFFAIANSGLIAVPLLPDFNPTEVETILKHAGISGMFVSDRLYEKIKHLDSVVIPFIVSLDRGIVLRGENVRPEVGELPLADLDEQDTASIIYTSGTTGRSKGVELTHKNLTFTALQCQFFHRVNKLDKALSFLPLSHVYEFTIGFLLMVLNGAAVYYLEKPPAVTTLLPAMQKIRPTIMLSVPMIMEKIYKNKIVPTFTKSAFIKKIYKIGFMRMFLHSIAGKSLKKTFGGRLKFFGIGGAKVDPDVERFMKEAHFPYAIGYGLTETSPLLAGSGPKITRPGTVGPIVPEVEMKILDPDPQTGIGEVVARGANIMKGYYKDPVLTAEAFTTENDSVGAGWFKTGDLGVLERSKRGPWLSLKGRSKNMILGSSGENIYPEDIEFVLNQHPLVTESLVIEEEGGLVALVQLNEEKITEEAKKKGLIGSVSDMVGEAVQNFTEGFLYKQEEMLAEIKFFVNENVNKFSKIAKVTPIEKFEKTASQKIKRYLYNFKIGMQNSGASDNAGKKDAKKDTDERSGTKSDK